MDNDGTGRHRLSAFLQLIRWWNLLIAATGFLVAYFAWVYPVTGTAEFRGEALPFWTLAGISLVIMYILAFGYLHNDWRDRLADKINIRDQPLVHHQISRGRIIVVLVAIAIVGWGLALMIGYLIGKMSVAVLYPIVPIALYIYNRFLKHQPLIGNVLVALLCAGVPWMAWLAIPNPAHKWGLAQLPAISYMGLALLSGLVFFTIMAREIVKDLEGRPGDLAAGSRTLPIVSGVGPAKRLVTMLLGMIPVLLIYAFVVRFLPVMPPWIVTAGHALIVLAFFQLTYQAYQSRRRDDFRRLERWIKYGLLIGTIDLIYVFGPWTF